MNMNELAKRVAEKEGKKVAVNIAQIKEVIRCTFEVLAEFYLLPKKAKRKARK